MSLQIAIDATLTGRARLGALTVTGVTVREHDTTLSAEIDRLAQDLRMRFTDRAWTDIPGVSGTRALYKSLGIDPTKTRPSSEALLRRVLRGEPLYRINSLVDAINLMSLSTQLPFGLYDFERVTPPVVLRLGIDTDGYEGIRKGTVHLAGRPLLADAHGPFGNPTSDSARTMIRPTTRDALIVVYAPSTTSGTRLDTVLDETLTVVTAHCGGSLAERQLVG